MMNRWIFPVIFTRGHPWEHPVDGIVDSDIYSFQLSNSIPIPKKSTNVHIHIHTVNGTSLQSSSCNPQVVLSEGQCPSLRMFEDPWLRDQPERAGRDTFVVLAIVLHLGEAAPFKSNRVAITVVFDLSWILPSLHSDLQLVRYFWHRHCGENIAVSVYLAVDAVLRAWQFWSLLVWFDLHW